jgi:hypothetical protein
MSNETSIFGQGERQMSIYDPSPFPLAQLERVLSGLASSTRVVLHIYVLIGVTLFPCVTPSVGLDLTESEAPVEQDDPSEEMVVRAQVRARLGRSEPGVPIPSSLHAGQILSKTGTARTLKSGQLPSETYMAPLRC